MTVAPRFQFKNGTLHAEDVSLAKLAREFGTPLYVYSRAALHDAWGAYARALAGRKALVCFGMKANSNLAVLNEFSRLGSGFDIVSGGELARVLAAGGDPGKVVFSGVGKQAWEMRAALDAGVKCFNVESEPELERLAQVASTGGRIAPVSLRVNPDVDAQTHPYISTGLKENKFGIAIERAPEVYRRARELEHLEIVGVDCHIGSQLTELSPFLDALDRVLVLVDQLAADGIELRHLDLGGGLGVTYRNEQPPHPREYAEAVLQRLQGRQLTLVLEPGRSISANAGVLLTRVEFLKDNGHKHFAIIDAAMNDLIRPSLYDAWMDIIPVRPRTDGHQASYDLVGPVCETGDFLGKDRPLNLLPGDLLVVRSAGAYGFVMSSNYNSRPRVAEIMVDGDQTHVVRQRETIAALFAHERILP